MWPICSKPVVHVSREIQFQEIVQKPYERHFFQNWYITTNFNFIIFILYEKPKNLNQINREGDF